MKTINLLTKSALLILLVGVMFMPAGFFASAQNINFNVCGYVSGSSPNTPAANAQVGGYITQGNGTVLCQFSSYVDSSGYFCTQYYAATPDSGGCAGLAMNLSVSSPNCNTSQSYTFYEWLCYDTTVYVNLSTCDSTSIGSCYAYISTDSSNMLSAWSNGTAPFAYQWYFNNQVISYYQSVSPNANGQYCVTVTDANGCAASDCYNYGQNNCTLSVALLLDSTPCMGPAHSLGSAVFGGTVPYSYTWSTGETTDFICNLADGQYCLTVTDANGCTATDCYYIQSTGNCSVSVYAFSDSSGITHLYADFYGTNPVSYQWYGNGALVDTTPYFTPNAFGQYCVTVTDDSGCSANACYYYGGNNNQCYVYFYSQSDSSNTGTVYFYPYASGTPPFTYSWTFSDGTTSTLETPSHAFTYSNGWDYACVEIADAGGCVSSYCDYVYISGDSGTTLNNCYASFGGYFDDYNGTSTSGEIFFMDYSWSTDSIISWAWDFGDGATSNLQNPSHIFSATGNYNVCLTITGANGCASSYCETWYVDTAWWGINPWGGNGTTCYAQFAAMQDSTVAGMVYLVDLSYGSNLFYTWTFASANGTVNQTISTQYPFVNFTQFGCFNICLTVTDTISGCQASFCDSICVDSLGNLNKATNWGLAVVASAMPATLFLSAKEEMQQKALVSVYPNPASSDVNLKISLEKPETVQVELYDFTGKAVVVSKQNFRAGDNNFRVDLNKIPSGVYFVKINSESLNHAEKIVKLK